jgi:hypothetical protein
MEKNISRTPSPEPFLEKEEKVEKEKEKVEEEKVANRTI